MPSEHKQHIARAFSQAAATYDEAAALQRQVGTRLLHLLEQRHQSGLAGRTVLDIGAGSGHFSRIMQEKGACVLALDLAEGMLRRIRAQQRAAACVLADAEALPLADSSIDICFSSLALQWCNLAQAAAEMQRITRAGGCIAVATLAEGSLWQLRQAWQAADDAPHVNRFLTPADIQTAFACCGQIEVCTETLTQEFAGLKSLLASLKHVGANHVFARRAGLTGKVRWQRFAAAYETLRNDKGLLPLDYCISYIVIAKP